MFGNKSIVLCFSTNPAVNERKVHKFDYTKILRDRSLFMPQVGIEEKSLFG